MGFKKFLGHREVLDSDFWRASFAEAIVTTIYIFIVCGQSIPVNPDLELTRLHGSLTVAFSVACLASAFWEISGGHFNPAVSLALLLLGKISLTRFISYLIFQCAGSMFIVYHFF